MSRLRFDGVSGTASGNPITLSSGTTNVCSWSTAPAFTSISAPDYAVISVEPDTSNEEIVYLVGYTTGGTTGLVQRLAEVSAGGTVTAITHSAVAWVHGPSALDFKSAPTRTYARTAFR